jgi:hypothetical protein
MAMMAAVMATTMVTGVTVACMVMVSAVAMAASAALGRSRSCIERQDAGGEDRSKRQDGCP